jgi:hypothetical protein
MGMVASLALACGEEMLRGNVGGDEFEVKVSVLHLVDGRPAGHFGFSPHADLCRQLSDKMVAFPHFNLSLRRSKDPFELEEMSYPIQSYFEVRRGASMPGPHVANVYFHGTAGTTSPNEGHVEVTSISDTEVRGRMDLRFQPEGFVSGPFRAVPCPP